MVQNRKRKSARVVGDEVSATAVLGRVALMKWGNMLEKYRKFDVITLRDSTQTEI